ncbi:uncharacterized protein LOC110230508 isoform X1 [Arabidopsis lyrata subsp. lyrata]|uniref:uncharacterized protein LOC110230508 isoform X1 n=1 Tax=Arabidopsis lyrata subsp. lyrata TaxID=81972 RepID=UPI000A29BC6B|nr:uncharacterized protein LOC110230508 isoform X1 [Arabidopsis lyrata subsp. lyrata]|eukprot:XP_020889407.1 uncharacterized protein LOC110230508 isoform X1 [Arabidopsis lyrata subsp. lyrata]
MAGGTKSQPKRQKKTTTANETQTTPVVHWTTEEKMARRKMSQVMPLPTRFANRAILERMGVLDTFDELLKKMGLSFFGTMDVPTFPLPTLDFLFTMQYTFANPKVPIAKEGIFHFKIKNMGYSISIPDLCEAYGFANNNSMCFPQFKGIHKLWNMIANGYFVGSSAKIKRVRHPVIRYVLKLIAHAFFGRSDTAATTVTELCFLFQGLKDVLLDFGEDADSGKEK